MKPILIYDNSPLTCHNIDNKVQTLHKLKFFYLHSQNLIPLERYMHRDFNEDKIESDECGKTITHKEHIFCEQSYKHSKPWDPGVIFSHEAWITTIGCGIDFDLYNQSLRF